LIRPRPAPGCVARPASAGSRVRERLHSQSIRSRPSERLRHGAPTRRSDLPPATSPDS
jgi:hypothetical protein